MNRMFDTGEQAVAWMSGDPPRWRRSLAGLLRNWARRIEPPRPDVDLVLSRPLTRRRIESTSVSNRDILL